MADSVLVPIVVTVLMVAALVYLAVFEVRRQRAWKASFDELDRLIDGLAPPALGVCEDGKD